MYVDRYTKLVLTVIAVCLVWISLGGPSLITSASAQGDGFAPFQPADSRTRIA